MKKFLPLLAFVGAWLLFSYMLFDTDTKAVCPRCSSEEVLAASCPWCYSSVCEDCNYSIQEDAEEDFKYLYYDGEELGLEQGYIVGFENAVALFLHGMTIEEIEAWREANADAFDEYEYLEECFDFYLRHTNN